MLNEKYTVLDDNKLTALWCCSECGSNAEVSVYDYQNIGSPYCADCDTDMVYVETREYCSHWDRII